MEIENEKRISWKRISSFLVMLWVSFVEMCKYAYGIFVIEKRRLFKKGGWFFVYGFIKFYVLYGFRDVLLLMLLSVVHSLNIVLLLFFGLVYDYMKRSSDEEKKSVARLICTHVLMVASGYVSIAIIHKQFNPLRWGDFTAYWVSFLDLAAAMAITRSIIAFDI